MKQQLVEFLQAIELQAKKEGYEYQYEYEEKFQNIIAEHKLTTVDQLFDGGLLEALTELYDKDFAEELKIYCNKQVSHSFQQGIYRRSIHSDSLKEHSNRILSLIAAGSLNKEAAVIEILRNYQPSYYRGIVDFYVNQKDTPVASQSFIEAKFAHLLTIDDTEAVHYVNEAIFGENNVAILTHQLIRSIVSSNNRKIIEWLGQLLLAAQRQEGTRQVILENADRGTPETLIYFMKLIKENDLLRFSSVQRAVETWVGLQYYVDDKKVIQKLLDIAYDILANDADVKPLIYSEDAIANYAALWATATLNVNDIQPVLQQLLQGNKHQILTALCFAQTTNLEVYLRYQILDVIMEQDDLDVLTLAMQDIFPYYAQSKYHFYDRELDSNYFEHYPKALISRLEQIAELMKKQEHTVQGKPFPWVNYTLTKEYISNGTMLLAVAWNDHDYVMKIYNNRKALTSNQRENLLGYIVEKLKLPVADEFLIECLQERGTRDLALQFITKKKEPLAAAQIEAVEQLFYLKSGATKQAILKVLVAQPLAIDSAQRLVKKTKQDLRLGGLELLVELKKVGSVSTQEIATIANSIAKPTAKEQELITALVEDTSQKTLAGGYGIFNPSYSKDAIPPLKMTINNATHVLTSFDIEKLKLKLQRLSDLFQEYAAFEYKARAWDGQPYEALLSRELQPLHGTEGEHIKNYPLADVWLQWKDDVQLTALDCLAVTLFVKQSYYGKEPWDKGLTDEARATLAKWINFDNINDFNYWLNTLANGGKIRGIIDLLCRTEYRHDEAFDYVYSALVELFQNLSTMPEWFERINLESDWSAYSYETYPLYQVFLRACQRYIDTDEQFTQLFSLCTAITTLHEQYNRETEEGSFYLPIFYADDEVIARAHSLGLVPIDACYLKMFNPLNDRYYAADIFDVKKREKLIASYPFLAEVYEKGAERIIDIELSRGDMRTEVSHFANYSLKPIVGVTHFARIMNALKGLTLVRGYVWSNDYTKREVFSSMLEHCKPASSDTVEDLATALESYSITEEELLNAMMYTPAYIPLISEYLGWQGLASAAWYFRAHTTNTLNDESMSQIQLYTSITANELQDGAFAHDWLLECYNELGKARFNMLYDSAKYASEGATHRRAQMFADAALGHIKLKPLMDEVADKRNKDKLRCIGLVPLSKKNPLKDAYKRYQFIQTFLKESKQFGAQRRESEGLACRIAIENLARNLGDDVTRFAWRMEIFELDAIKIYFEPIEVDDITLYLQADEKGIVDFVVKKADKQLKSVPARLKKNKIIQEMTDVRKQLREQQSRSRRAFEEAMEKGTTFTSGEIKGLLEHPVLAPMLAKLYIVSDSIIGLIKDLELADDAEARIAHPYDLYASKKWAAIQHEVFANEIIQPFKQIFRELYVVNVDEQDKKVSSRYAGHQIQPQKTLAMLKTRGWTASYDEGLRKIYYDQDIIVTIYAMADWFSPADIEAPTIEYVAFYNRRTGKPILLQDVPPLIFSEAMRDVDLVVSVAHVGGVDPEASFSTIKTRAAIVRELAQMLKLPKVSVEKQHVLIEGSLARYSVHLGSGTVHKVGGAMMPILAIQSQHRGRIFLPFADEDPRTAEIMSKIVLLSEDNKIKDPSILQLIK
ncbi:DUF4132 domain-containing protein [Metasolibacillus meyeri]|uniref:DUF4132 domain-containing protein n=1 Tax=Metasolibacillus meyeri TaxID=1071052 RepID=A0AAW9NPZ5_9BACL|nr:DUF4132 domain-containing protein [Metasolibacillus meyeri]MEC1177794.1 DUF4132 domain-containing protein [Metasolibacillus meyeri]